MSETYETIEGADTSTSSATQPSTSVEASLTGEIESIWAAHRESAARVKQSKAASKTLRQDLGLRLFEMKSTLAGPSRSDGWASYLRSHRIPRATADRYVRNHASLLHPSDDRVIEATKEPTEDDIKLLVRKLLPRLRDTLTTPEWVEWFAAEVAHQLQGRGGAIAGS